MGQDAMAGIDFKISGVVETENSIYAILVDGCSSLYFPVACEAKHAFLVDMAMSGRAPFQVQSFGLYFTFASLLKANGVRATEVAIIVGKNKTALCYVDFVQENELGTKVSRIPVMMPDAMVLCAVLKVPVVLYGSVGTDFAFSIDKNIPRKSIFAFICADIAKSERLMLLQSRDEERDEE